MRARLQDCAPNHTDAGRYPAFRVVHNRRRMLKLRRRGVKFVTSVRCGHTVWLWHVVDNNPTRAVQQFLKRRTRAKARRAERLREMFRYMDHYGIPYIHSLDARPRHRHWQDEPLPFLQQPRLAGASVGSLGIELGSVASAAEGIQKGYGVRNPLPLLTAKPVPPMAPPGAMDADTVSYIDYTLRNVQLELYASIVGPRLAGQIVDGLPEVSPEEDAAARMYFLPREVYKHPDETDAEYKARAFRTNEVEFVALGPADECVDGWLCCNYFPVGEPVNGKQLMRCERPGCNKQYEDDCT